MSLPPRAFLSAPHTYSYVPGVTKTRPKNYPENIFGRFPLHKDLIRLVIGRLQSDDVYLASSTFPNPDQRSTALANQVGKVKGRKTLSSQLEWP